MTEALSARPHFSHPYQRLERRPRMVVWDITRLCNLRCVHCENRSGPRSERELSLSQMLTVAEGLAKLGCEYVDITGGEPLTFSAWDTLCARLTELGLKVSLITNGLLLDERRLEKAVRAGVGLVVVSLDGEPTIHDQTRQRKGPGPSPFRLAWEGLMRAHARLPVAVLTQINRQNLDNLPALHARLVEANIPRWQVQLAVPSGRLLDFAEPYVLPPSELPKLVQFLVGVRRAGGLPELEVSDNIGYYTESELWLRQRAGRCGMFLGCVAGHRTMAITYDGRVRGCSMMPEEFDAGDLHDENIERIWSDQSRFPYTLVQHQTPMTGACSLCQFSSVCRGGCTTMAYYATGVITENPYCLHRLTLLKTAESRT